MKFDFHTPSSFWVSYGNIYFLKYMTNLKKESVSKKSRGLWKNLTLELSKLLSSN